MGYCVEGRLWFLKIIISSDSDQRVLVYSYTSKHETSHNVGLLLGQRRSRWPNIKPTLGEVSCLLEYIGSLFTENTQTWDKSSCHITNQGKLSYQRRASVWDVSPTFNQCNTTWEVSCQLEADILIIRLIKFHGPFPLYGVPDTLNV